MNLTETEQARLELADAEATSVSAGARVASLTLTLETGQSMTIDLTKVPLGRRLGLVAELHEIVNRARSYSRRDIERVRTDESAKHAG